MEHMYQADQSEETLNNAFQGVGFEPSAEAQAYYAQQPNGYVPFGQLVRANIPPAQVYAQPAQGPFAPQAQGPFAPQAQGPFAPQAQGFALPRFVSQAQDSTNYVPPAQGDVSFANFGFEKPQQPTIEQPLIEDIVYEKDIRRRMTVSMIDDQGYQVKRTMPKVTGYSEGRLVQGRLAGVNERTYLYKVGKDAQETFANREQSKRNATQILKLLNKRQKAKNYNDECEEDEEDEEDEEEDDYYDNYDETDDETDDDDDDNKTYSSKRSSAHSSKRSRKSTLRSNKKPNLLAVRQAIALLKKEAPHTLR